MSDDLVALGLASRGDGDRLSVWLVEVRLNADNAVDVTVLERWQGTRGRDDASQLIDVHDVIVNALDSPRLGPIKAVAVKRAESTPGRPSNPYDRKIRFEGAAMLAAHAQGKRYFGYRKIQLGRGKELAERARAAAGAPSDAESLEALDAACAALSDLC
jgi:hypothetical protein